MGRPIKTILLIGIIAGGIWALVNRDQLGEPEKLWAQLQAKIRSAAASFQSNPLPTHQSNEQWITEPVIRIASFKLDRFGSDPADLNQLPLLADICRRYDVIALQNLDGRHEKWLEALADGLQSLNPHADFAFVTDAVPSARQPSQNAILFNRQTLELDQSKWYLVQDPEGLLERRPLVGWFRTKVSDRNSAFTFSLVNVELQHDESRSELEYLTHLFRAVRNDGRGEDDVILAGDFNSGDQGLTLARQTSGLTWVIAQCPTDVRQIDQADNLVFQPQATLEFTGRGGVLDFMRIYNLRLSDAELLSPRLPVWAEFSAFEGGMAMPPTHTAQAELRHDN